MMRPAALKVRNRNRGTILVAAIVCLVLAIMMAAALARSLVMQQRQCRVERQRLQTLWLTESGAARAAGALAANPQYAGELWQVALPAAQGPVKGTVEIVVEAIPEQPVQRLVRVHARWPQDSLTPVSHRKQFAIQLPAQGDRS